MVLDFGLLSHGRIFNETKVYKTKYDRPLVTIDRDDNFENPETALSMSITLYKAQQSCLLRNLRSFSSGVSEGKSIFQKEEEDERRN
mmetsp:Transcript_25103/g.38921  ORF Transcript_25103/g.38921 Transcript_25103/m.38921 type:complete len:87 (+) Transcript_25103:1619-1879(+)